MRTLTDCAARGGCARDSGFSGGRARCGYNLASVTESCDNERLRIDLQEVLPVDEVVNVLLCVDEELVAARRPS